MSPGLSLTFDDGPDRRGTAAVLDALRAGDVCGTFFMVGEQVRATPELARAVIDEGHAVQLHCDRHVRHCELSELEIERDTRAALETLAELSVRPTLWRTPWGVCTPASERVARRHGLALAHWTIDTHDWRGDAATDMLERAREGLADGAVVLMHDAIGPGATRKSCANTVELLGPLIAATRDAGLQVRSLSPETALDVRSLSPEAALDVRLLSLDEGLEVRSLSRQG